MVETLRPSSLAEALELRSVKGALPFAGGTDLMVKYRAKNGLAPTVPGPVMFVDAIPELCGAVLDEDYLTLGASLSMAVIADDPGERAACASSGAAGTDALDAIPTVLCNAAADLGATALRQRAVIAGNVANASPAGDTVAAFYALDADVVLASMAGERVLPISDFITGPGRTLLAGDELIRAIRIRRPLPDWGYWRKVGTRRANALTKVSLASRICTEGGFITSFSLAFGAVGPTVVRSVEAEALVTGLRISDAEGIDPETVTEVIRPHINPINDQRSTARYRKTVALNLAEEALNSLAAYLKEKS